MCDKDKIADKVGVLKTSVGDGSEDAAAGSDVQEHITVSEKLVGVEQDP